MTRRKWVAEKKRKKENQAEGRPGLAWRQEEIKLFAKASIKTLASQR